MVVGESYTVAGSRSKRRKKARTHRVVKKKRKASRSRRTAVVKPKAAALPDDPDYNPYLECEDTCNHVHGIDLSHYQGEVFWETVGQNTKMAYVYLKATEGGDRVDAKYERNIELAHRYGLKVGSYHFFRPKTPLQLQLRNFMTQCLPGEQDLIPMIDVESTGNLPTAQFCDSLLTFLKMVEKAYRQKPLVYTFRNFYNWHLVGKIDDYQLMVAMYKDGPPVLADERDYTLWQYTAKGRIVGINGYVDKSMFMGRHGLRELRFRH
ncbi:MAG: glycosyl hydrolase family 25 [Prevotella sp.]|nr:glycosyl hydrolase family 25 [Prevotella sp.]